MTLACACAREPFCANATGKRHGSAARLAFGNASLPSNSHSGRPCHLQHALQHVPLTSATLLLASFAAPGPEFLQGAPLEAHGAVWAVLAGPAAQADSPPAAARLLGLGADPSGIPRAHALLQLLCKATSCAGPQQRRPLWGSAVDAALRGLQVALRRHAGAAGAATAAGQPGPGASFSSAAAGVGGQGQEAGAAVPPVGDDGPGLEEGQQHEDEEEVGEGEEDMGELKLHGLDAEGLVLRRARQLYPACWRMLKELLASGGGGGAGKAD